MDGGAEAKSFVPVLGADRVLFPANLKPGLKVASPPDGCTQTHGGQPMNRTSVSIAVIAGLGLYLLFGSAVPGQSQSLTAAPTPDVDKVSVAGNLPMA